MKKICLLLLLLITLKSAVHAQIGFEGGINFANLSIKENGEKLATKYLIGAALGMFADIRLGDGGHMYFEPGAYYHTNGAKVTGPPSWKYIIGAGSFPLDIEYKSGEKCGQRFFVGIGPYFGYNINNSSEIWGNYLENIDFGLGLNLGFIGKKHLYIRGRYQFGLRNELPNGDSKNSIKQQYGCITLGYMIRGCRRSNGYGGSGGRSGNHWRGLRHSRWSTHEYRRRPPGPGY